MRASISFVSLALILCAAPLSATTTATHPFARSEAPSRLGFSLPGIEWGSTTLSYSQAWFGGSSASRGLLTKELFAPLAPGLEFQAQFGLQFTPGLGSADGEAQPNWVLPYAALNWEPSDHFQLRLEYSQYGSGWGSPSRLYSDPFRGPGNHLRQRTETANAVAP